MVNIDTTKNNASNLHLATPEGELSDALHSVVRSVDTLRAFLAPLYTPGQLDMLSKNDMIFAVRQFGEGLDSITITGDATVEEEATIQLVATATYLTGISQDVTALAAWESDDEAAATVAGGLVTGVSADTATITATLFTESDTHEVTVTAP